jgi:hypothetical protein
MGKIVGYSLPKSMTITTATAITITVAVAIAERNNGEKHGKLGDSEITRDGTMGQEGKQD